MSVPTIDQLPIAPQVTDAPTVFSSRANTFVAALSTLVTQTNATVAEINQALAGALVQFNAYQGDWEQNSYALGDVVRKDDIFYISLVNSNQQEPPGANWQELLTANSVSYDNAESGLAAQNAQEAIDETFDRADTFVVNDSRVKTAVNATAGDMPLYAVRAWVNFNGITNTIRDSGNVSSVVRTSSGRHTVNFIEPMPDSNYSVTGSQDALDSSNARILVVSGYTTTSINTAVSNESGGASTIDVNAISLQVVR